MPNNNVARIHTKCGESSGNWRGGPETRNCRQCGAKFSAPRWSEKLNCSRACYFASLAGSGNGNYRDGHAITKTNCCPTCGREFTAFNQTYCSRKCVPQTGESNAYFKHGKAVRREKPREWCGAKFIGHDGNRFCSRTCKGKWNIHQRFNGPDGDAWRAHYSAMNAGVNNANWRDGSCVIPYAAGWSRRDLKRRIRQRDGNECYACHGAKKRLVVHHIDLAKTNHDPSNLITLCQTCHVRLHHSKWEFIPDILAGHLRTAV